MRHHTFSGLGRAAAVFAIGLAAALAVHAQDLAGAKDHPLVKRFAGATIVGQDHKRFDAYTLQTGTFTTYDLTAKRNEYRQQQLLEGAVTRLWYEAPGTTSSTELLRNYQNELKAQGFSILYDSTQDTDAKRWNNYLAAYGYLGLKTSRSPFVFTAAKKETIRFSSLKLARPEGDVFVAVTTVEWAKPDKTYKAERGAYAAVDIVEVGAMKQQMVAVSAGEMSKSMASTGRVALYGILFDTGKAELKAESKPALDEIGKLLKGEPALRLRIVGHTDNQGALDANIALSKRRAEAVNAALVAQHGVAAARLAAFGVADLAPVASNGSEDGRAKNRRVELVPQ